MAEFMDITGHKYGLLTVTSFSHSRKAPNGTAFTYFNVECDCGNKKIVQALWLRRKNRPVTSCGCKSKNRDLGGVSVRFSKLYEWHKRSGHKISDDWKDMRVMLADIKNPRNQTIAPVDPLRLIGPDNWQWATMEISRRKKVNNRYITIDGQTKCISEWASEIGISEDSFRCRLERNWKGDRLLSKPRRPAKKSRILSYFLKLWRKVV